MENVFLTEININSVRHLRDIFIPLDTDRPKHLILTGKNGSGKTSVLEALAENLQFTALLGDPCFKKTEDLPQDAEERRNLRLIAYHFNMEGKKIRVKYSSLEEMYRKFQEGQFVLAYYGARRMLETEPYKDIEMVTLKDRYNIMEKPGNKFTKYLVNLRATQALSARKGQQTDRAEKIERWFDHLTEILRDIYEDPALTVQLDPESFQFTIHATGREPFDFNTMASGYGAIFDIVSDLIIRMEAQSKLRDSFDLEGIVLIDEIEAHLHLELQRKILPVLTEIFPNIQFIISTHSPFVLNSMDDVVIYDLEKRLLSAHGMKHLPYEGIVEGYFNADRLSDELRQKFERYQELVSKHELTDEEYAEIDSLEYYLDEIPDYLASELASEYSRLKLEFSNREQ